MTASAIRLGGHLGLRAPDRPLLAHLGRSVAALDQIDALADHGFAAVQDLFLKGRSGAECDAMAARMAQRGLVLSSFNGDPATWNTPLWSCDEASGRERLHDSVLQSAWLAHQFGGAGAVCVAGLDPNRQAADQRAAMIENLSRMADVAAPGGLTLMVEPIASQRVPGMLLDQLEPAVEIIRAVDHPSVRLLFDIGHVAMMGHDPAQALLACGDAIGLVQAADVSGDDRVDIGLGTLDWRAIGSALRAIGYTGVVELEHEPVEQTAQGEAALLSRLAALTGERAARN